MWYIFCGSVPMKLKWKYSIPYFAAAALHQKLSGSWTPLWRQTKWIMVQHFYVVGPQSEGELEANS